MTEAVRKLTTAEIREALKAHAIEHYERGGWDFLVECWSDEEIDREIDGSPHHYELPDASATTRRRPRCHTIGGAIRHFKSILSLHDERRRAVLNEVF